MPTEREREYYAMGFRDGSSNSHDPVRGGFDFSLIEGTPKKKKRKLSAWNKFVKANANKPRFRYRNGKLNLKKMAIAFRKTPAGKKKRR